MLTCILFQGRKIIVYNFHLLRRFLTSVVFEINRSSECDNFTVLFTPSHLQQDTFAFLAKVVSNTIPSFPQQYETDTLYMYFFTRC